MVHRDDIIVVLNVKEEARVGQKNNSVGLLSSMSSIAGLNRPSYDGVARYTLEPFMADTTVARP